MGLIFTKGDLKEVSEEVAKYKVCCLKSFELILIEIYAPVFVVLHITSVLEFLHWCRIQCFCR